MSSALAKSQSLKSGGEVDGRRVTALRCLQWLLSWNTGSSCERTVPHTTPPSPDVGSVRVLTEGCTSQGKEGQSEETRAKEEDVQQEERSAEQGQGRLVADAAL